MNNANYIQNMHSNFIDNANASNTKASTMNNEKTADKYRIPEVECDTNTTATGNTHIPKVECEDNAFMDTSFLDNINMMGAFNEELFFDTNPSTSVNFLPQCPTPPVDCFAPHGLPADGLGVSQLASYSGTTNEDIKEILMSMLSRMENLESGGAQNLELLRQVGFNVDMALPKLLSITESVRTSVENLANSLKVFTRALLNHVLGWHIEGDVEMGPGA
ncbi:hypothetical protein B0J13DRAFT_566571 [Dactylonectria estremocensis]|uniref:Uncharacterized protein n=1 Tax=Dactylonectria estremocensis TaxID=1079267 RepID=A0A9P9DQY4_9HYPO|nr:hypothetical protein B0J13DRAFT_566571 [Dactylonectria estremocensis]